MTSQPRPASASRRTALVLGVVVVGMVLGATILLTGGWVRPAATDAPPSGVAPTFDAARLHAYADLEAKIPREIGGVELETYSLSAGEDDDPGIGFFVDDLAAVGRDPRELQLAFGGSKDPDPGVIVVAYRMPGMSGEDLIGLLSPDDVDGTLDRIELAGKAVLELNELETSYAYAAANIVYVVAGDPQLVEALLRALP